MNQASQRIYLKDYTPPPYRVNTVELTFELDPERTVVTNQMHVIRNTGTAISLPLVLDGEMITLLEVSIDGRTLKSGEISVTPKNISIQTPPTETFTVVVKNTCAPIKNTALEGLYLSSGMFCTQNEPEGFRRITYFLDRSDVMARYRTTIIADGAKYPVLLSNGNLVASGTTADGKLRVTWEDPFPKPSYLFALVAGDLGMIEGTFVRRSGRPVTLRIYTDKGNEKRCTYGLQCLKRAMKWDEDTFGLEYDLDIFMIVAVNDFNFGAMENKGLNIFSARAVLADSETATDERLVTVDAIIAHEYFHNWTGDRVTCRDWFQLTLKEGLTVLRDQLYTADVTDPDEKRIVDAAEFERDQFPEDAGPLAHPIQPKSFVEINNFYTTTVYDKGAEVIRMMRTIIGPDAFRRGIDTYFTQNDGKAVTTEDFVRAIEQGSGADLRDFRRWYDQSGTPELVVQSKYNATTREFVVTLTQRHPNGKYFNPDGSISAPKPVVLPVAMGLIGHDDGKEITLELVEGAISSQSTSRTAVLMLTSESQTFRFRNVQETPVLSILRGFSAPVRVVYQRAEQELATLLSHDTDSYARWRAGQELFRGAITGLIAEIQAGRSLSVSESVVDAFSSLLKASLAPGLLALMMEIPAESTFTDQQEVSDFEATHHARNFLLKTLAGRCRKALNEIYTRAYAAGIGDSYQAMGNRRLALRALSYLTSLEEPEVYELCERYQSSARNMSEEYGGLALLVDSPSPLKEKALSRFYGRWSKDPVVSSSWITAQATSTQPDTLTRCQMIEKDPIFVLSNPSKVLALYRNFAANQIRFNAPDGSGYRFIADAILKLDAINPNMGAAVSKCFTRVHKLPPPLRTLVATELGRISSTSTLSKNTREVIEAAERSLVRHFSQ